MSATANRLLDNYVAGRWTPAQAATDVLDVINPASGEPLARVPLSGTADLDAGVEAARAALPEWRAVSAIGRARKMFELRERLLTRSEDLARSVTLEMGKTIGDARAEVARMIEMVEAAHVLHEQNRGGSALHESSVLTHSSTLSPERPPSLGFCAGERKIHAGVSVPSGSSWGASAA